MERTQEGSFQGSQEAHQRTLNQKLSAHYASCRPHCMWTGAGSTASSQVEEDGLVLRLCLSDSRLAQGIRKMQAWESALPVGPLAAI